MSLGVVILAGGYGTRLAGIWDGPKCLVPVGGRPLLDRLLRRIVGLRPERVVLSLAHRADEVLTWTRAAPRFDAALRLFPVVEAMPTGTAGALRACAGAFSTNIHNVLVVNGDTLPCYTYSEIVVAAMSEKERPTVAWCRKRNALAGAAVLPSAYFAKICASNYSNLDTYLADAKRCFVPNFLDVGTPDGFLQAKEWK